MNQIIINNHGNTHPFDLLKLSVRNDGTEVLLKELTTLAAMTSRVGSKIFSVIKNSSSN